MRILYVGTELAEAQAIATAVNSLDERVTVSLTSGLDRVASWIDENDGLRVLVVDAHNGPVWRSVLTYTAGLATALPVVVIVPEEIASDLQPFALEGHECVVRTPSLFRELPAVITRAIDQAQQRQLERSGRADLERKLAQAASLIHEAEHRHQAAMAAAAEQLAKTQSQYEMRMARVAATRDMVIEQFREAGAEVERVRLSHASAVADAERLARREAELAAVRQQEFERKLSEEIDNRLRVEGTLARALTADKLAKQRHASAMTAAAVQFRELQAALNAARYELGSKIAHLDALATRETELTSLLNGATASRETTERRLESTETALQEANEQIRQARGELVELRREKESAVADVARLSERETSLVSELAERTARFERELAEAEAKRSALNEQLREVETDRDQAKREHQSVVADFTRLTEREAMLDGRLKEERETRNGLEQEIAGAVAALRGAQEAHHATQAASIAQLAEADAKRSALSEQLRNVEEDRDQIRREHQSVVADLSRSTEREAELERLLKDEGETRASLEQEIEGAAAALRGAKEGHHAAMAAAAAELAERQAHYERERAQVEAERTAHVTRLRELEEARDQARRDHECALADLTRETEHAARERDASAARQTDLEARISLLNEEIATLRVTALVQGESLERLTREHAAILAARDNDIERLRRQRDVLQADSNQLPGLHQELQKSRTDNHRLFQQAPVPMFRCTKDGTLTLANRMLTSLLGRRSPDDLRGADWLTEVFESPADLSWLIERCLGSKGKESTETSWRRKDGSRLLVRLSGCATSTDLIEVGVEDLTPIRVLNDRLTQAHRMEAVGRLAAEVAVTCGSLLGSVHQNAQQLLLTDDSNSSSRQRSEMLLDEISRAAGLLRQLAAYSDEESRKPAMVELRTVVRDVAPVLKRVAGDDVEVQLPAASDPLNVDAGAERVQRLLVNLAAYGRERMPFGGRLKIELGRIVVDRHFAAKHPHVRLGPHALVTVTESRHAARAQGPKHVDENEAGSNSRSVALPTGVDLGTLQELVADCGGHLWMTVEPAGDMIAKIRLPLVTSYGEPPRRRLAAVRRARSLVHLFQQ